MSIVAGEGQARTRENDRSIKRRERLRARWLVRQSDSQCFLLLLLEAHGSVLPLHKAEICEESMPSLSLFPL